MRSHCANRYILQVVELFPLHVVAICNGNGRRPISRILRPLGASGWLPVAAVGADAGLGLGLGLVVAAVAVAGALAFGVVGLLG